MVLPGNGWQELELILKLSRGTVIFLKEMFDKDGPCLT